MPGTFVRPWPSMRMGPRSVLTPSRSRPRFSTLPTTPTAEMTRSAASVRVPPLPSSMTALTLSAPFPSLRHDLDALPLEALAGEGRDLGIFRGQDLRQHLNHRNLGAQGAEERGKLDADGPRSDHEQGFGNGRRHHGLEVGPHELLVGLKAG